jgi:hypothetical protein
MATNHKPVIKGTDYGIWRRIKLIPFTTRIPEEKQDKYLERKLKAEASGILNRLLEGARRWASEGLNTPPVITGSPGRAYYAILPTVLYRAGKCYGMRRICGNGGQAVGRYAPPSVCLSGEAGGGVRGLPGTEPDADP